MKIIDINTSRRLRRIIEFGQLAAAFTILCGTLQAYSSGPPPRYSGAPGDNLGSCSFCHRGLAVNGGPGSVTIVLPGGNRTRRCHTAHYGSGFRSTTESMGVSTLCAAEERSDESAGGGPATDRRLHTGDLR